MTSQTTALSVSEAMQLAKGKLEGIQVRIMGEVSELTEKPGYKAVYFSVKDGSATLPCMMWVNRYRESGVPLRLGALVEITGRFTLYAAKGRMNFDVFSLSLAGEGQLRLQVAQLAHRLNQEGLFAPEKKRPIPAFPEHIGLVTSPRGAAVHDVLRTLRRRFPLARISLAGVPVEGPQAPQYIAQGIRACAEAGVELVLLVRGGGSYEDLMPFNDEMLARTIAACPVPVVTGIGHEPDNSIVDMVADLRASTPTAAAESISVSQQDIASRLNHAANRMSSSMRNRIAIGLRVVEAFRSRPLFSDSEVLFGAAAQGLDLAQLKFESLSRDFDRNWKAPVFERAQKLKSALPYALAKDRAALQLLEKSLSQSLSHLIQAPTQRYQKHNLALSNLLKQAYSHNTAQIKQLEYRTNQLAHHMFKDAHHRLKELDRTLLRQGTQLLKKPESDLSLRAARLHDVSPLTILARGYSFAQDSTGQIIKSVQDCHVAEELTLNFHDGKAQARIESVQVSNSHK